MSYRPVTDMWLLARAKLKNGEKYYGAYLGGFPERARVLLGASLIDPVLHVCGGKSRLYPYSGGFGPNDKTLDLDATLDPDFKQNATDDLPKGFVAMLADPPYSPEDAAHYAVGATNYPSPNEIVRRMLESVDPGRRVGIIHYVVPKCPVGAKFVACIGIICGFNNRIRCFSVFQKETQ